MPEAARLRFELVADDTVMERNDAILEANASFEEAADFLATSLAPHIMDGVIETFNHDRQDETEATEKLVTEAKQALEFLRNASDEEAEQAIRQETAGLFVMSGLDHEPNPEENFEALYAARKADYDAMLTMTDDELRQRFTLEDDQLREIDARVYGKTIEATVNTMLKAFLHGAVAPDISAADLEVEVVKVMMSQPRRRVYGPNERGIHGYTLPETRSLVSQVIGAIVSEGLLSEGVEIVKLNNEEKEDIFNPRTEFEVQRFVLRTVA